MIRFGVLLCLWCSTVVVVAIPRCGASVVFLRRLSLRLGRLSAIALDVAAPLRCACLFLLRWWMRGERRAGLLAGSASHGLGVWTLR